MLNENVKKLLKENMWDLATCSAEQALECSRSRSRT